MLANRLLLTKENKVTIRESPQIVLIRQHKSAPNHYTNTENAMLDGPDASSQQEGCSLKGHFNRIMVVFS